MRADEGVKVKENPRTLDDPFKRSQSRAGGRNTKNEKRRYYYLL